MICEKCGKEFSEDWRKDKRDKLRFCSRSCANSRIKTEEVREKVRETLLSRNPDCKPLKYFCACGKRIAKHNLTCKKCRNEKMKIDSGYVFGSEKNLYLDRRRRIRKILTEEAGGKCEICGYDKFNGALEFHHRDPNNKLFNISGSNLALSINKIKEETKKCALLCANCHREVHAGIIKIS